MSMWKGGGEAAGQRQRARRRNDVGAIGRMPGTLGYKGDLGAATSPEARSDFWAPRADPHGTGQNYANVATTDKLPDCTSHRLASRRRCHDRNYISNLTKRVGKALGRCDAIVSWNLQLTCAEHF